MCRKLLIFHETIFTILCFSTASTFVLPAPLVFQCNIQTQNELQQCRLGNCSRCAGSRRVIVRLFIFLLLLAGSESEELSLSVCEGEMLELPLVFIRDMLQENGEYTFDYQKQAVK